MFAAWGRFVHRRRWLVLLASVLTLVAAIAAVATGFTGTPTDSEIPEDLEAGRAINLIDKQLPNSPVSYMLVFSSEKLRVTDAEFKGEVERALAPLRKEPEVSAIRTAYDNPQLSQQLVSKDGHSTFATVELDVEFEDASKAYPQLAQSVQSEKLEVLATNGVALNHAFNEVAHKDLARAETFSLPLVLIALLVVFGSAMAAGLSLGVGLLAVAGGFIGTLILARFVTVSTYATNVVTMIGLGVAIDYSLFVVSRFREELSRRGSVAEAIECTMATAGRTVLFSGLTVGIGLGGLMFFTASIGTMGLAGTIVVALAIFYSLTFLPAMLAILGPRVHKLRVPFIHPERTSIEHGVWHRIATSVMKRPWRVLLPTTALLLLLGSPFLHMKLGQGDATALPKNDEARRAVELLQKEFPGGETTGVTLVLNYGQESPLTENNIGTLYDASRWLAKQPNVARVDSAVDLDPSLSRAQYQRMLSGPREALTASAQAAVKSSVGEHIAVLTAYTPFKPSTEEARNLVRGIREGRESLPVEALVTGDTAFDLDLVQSIRRDLPEALGFIMIATYVVLFLLLGSVLLPLKAVLMNFLSISASYGALVWIFQDGHLANVLQFTPIGLTYTTTPILMFCILFGLSMDYEVLLLSRVKEEYDVTGDNTAAVAHALEKTGRLITSAAVIMAGVFFAFGTADMVGIKAIGIGMGLAVAIDATIVRALLVPATMRLMGNWNWWAPRPLARLYHKLGLAETSGELPQPVREPVPAQ